MTKDRFATISYLFHFCDTRNVPLIRKLRGLYSLEMLEKKGIEVPAPGGNDWSREADRKKGLHKFVHLGEAKRQGQIFTFDFRRRID